MVFMISIYRINYLCCFTKYTYNVMRFEFKDVKHVCIYVSFSKILVKYDLYS